MAGPPLPSRDRSSALIAGVLSLGLFAGVALANPSALERSVRQASQTILGSVRTDPGVPTEGAIADTHTSEDCAAVVEGYQGTASSIGGIDHAIEVVVANCGKDPQAKGLLNALEHLRRNAERHAAREDPGTSTDPATEGSSTGASGERNGKPQEAGDGDGPHDGHTEGDGVGDGEGGGDANGGGSQEHGLGHGHS